MKKITLHLSFKNRFVVHLAGLDNTHIYKEIFFIIYITHCNAENKIVFIILKDQVVHMPAVVKT